MNFSSPFSFQGVFFFSASRMFKSKQKVRKNNHEEKNKKSSKLKCFTNTAFKKNKKGLSGNRHVASKWDFRTNHRLKISQKNVLEFVRYSFRSFVKILVSSLSGKTRKKGIAMK
jgi:hypothetical protein